MPIKSWIEKDKKRVMAIVSGSFSIEDILININNTIEDPDFEKGFNILSDHTKIESVITTEQARMTASHLERLSKYFANSKWAVVTKKEVSIGMMRMLSVFLENIPIHLEVFKSLDEAEKWLDKQ